MSDKGESTIQLEAGSYEIIRSRLGKSRVKLEEGLKFLNDTRKEIFGGVETELLSTVRIHTDNNCIAQDIIALGDKCVFGFNVHIGLRAVTKVADVFAVYHYENANFVQDDMSIIGDTQFEQDLENLYKYYRNSEFYRFWKKGAFLYMIFKVSDKEGDYKAFKWLVNDSTLKYVDNRSEHEYKAIEQYSFEWKTTTRDDFRNGRHPHVTIQDRLFVETVGGDLTIKVEDNTDDGKGIYNELVENKDQQLDDAEVAYADLGSLIALRIVPYLEAPRYFIYNEKLEEVYPMPAMGSSGQLLPGEHGVIVSDGYYLKTGASKQFDLGQASKQYETRISSTNGEDHLYVYFDPVEGQYVLMSYNIISQEVDVPMVCNGYSIFHDGTLGYFRRDPEPTKHHTIQLWTTPYGKEIQSSSTHEDNLLYKVGNKEIVSFMSECGSLISLIRKENPYADLYTDIVSLCTSIKDSYYWIDREESQHIDQVLLEIKESSEVAIGEYQKVVSIKKATSEATEEVLKAAEKQFKDIDTLSLDSISTFISAITSLRGIRGQLLTTKELRYADIPRLEAANETAGEKSLQLEKQCVRFLLETSSLGEYEKRINEVEKSIEGLKSSVAANELISQAEQIGKDLELLIDVVGSLKIDDPTETTKIIENISVLYASVNGLRSRIKQKYRDIRGGESKAEFDAQLRLLDQSVLSAIELSDTPEACSEALNRLMLLLEEIEGKFIEQDDYIEVLHSKREEISSTFETKRLQLVETLNKRTLSLASSGKRLVAGITKRALKLKESSEINGFYAADVMIQKVRSIAENLREAGDSVKADDLLSQLSSSKEEAIRSLRDKVDLYAGGENVINFGQHSFSVNNQQLELAIIPRDGSLYVHLTGTEFFQKIEDQDLNALDHLWDQTYISENKSIYRSEYLLYQFIAEHKSIDILGSTEVDASIKSYMSTRLGEGYERGIHDLDAITIGKALYKKQQETGLLIYDSLDRALGRLYWERCLSAEEQAKLKQAIASCKSILHTFPDAEVKQELSMMIGEGITQVSIPSMLEDADPLVAAQSLVESLVSYNMTSVALESKELAKDFLNHLKMIKGLSSYQQNEKVIQEDYKDHLNYINGWLKSYVDQEQNSLDEGLVAEAIVHLSIKTKAHELIGSPKISLKGMSGDHALIESGNYNIDYSQFFKKLDNYTSSTIPKFELLKNRKQELVEDWKRRLKLEELKPRVLSSFVRNQLIDKVYLPIIGDNLAKQMGTVGEGSRTDRMGLLLLVSPPGYGKTTLMEYVAERLGLTFVKINGPSLGHDITSLDPAYANSSGAKQELEKLNMSLEIGDNIMIYLDDIQHCNAEFLQKFISLTDGQRKIEGVYNGVAKTYDFRGKKVAVVMAGNPYTEAGEKFNIPDMLANRADVYNLGDMLAGSDEYFKDSYIENALSSNQYLQRVAAKSLDDVYTILDHIKKDDLANIQLEHSHTPEEVQEYVSVLQKLITIRDTILLVNAEYIKSAAISDAYRVEPPFKLQGSYRNMNKMAEKVVPVMNTQEVNDLIMDHYNSEVQTLTSNAEANLLLFKKLTDRLSPEEAERLDYINTKFKEEVSQSSGDFIRPVIDEIRNFNEILKSIRDQMK